MNDTHRARKENRKADGRDLLPWEKACKAKGFAKSALPYLTMPISVWIIANSEKTNRLARSVLSIATSLT